MGRTLPILVTAIAVYKTIGSHLTYMVRISWPWYVMLVLVFAASFPLANASEPVLGVVVGLVLIAISLVAWSVIAVLWHRRLLRGEEFGVVQVRLNRRTWLYFLRFVAICLIVIAPMIVAFIPILLMDLSSIRFSVVDVAFLVSLPITIIVSLRLSLALPAVALDEVQFAFGDAWRATRGNSIRLLVISIITAIPFMMLNVLISASGLILPAEESAFTLPLLLGSLHLAIDLASVLTGVTLLSLVYAYLVEHRAAGTTMSMD